MSIELYRSMKTEDDGLPLCAPVARGLGARVPKDIATDDDGLVHPRTGGMSVTPHDPSRLPAWRKPRSLGGYGKDPVFMIRDDDLGEAVTYHEDDDHPGWHGFVEPGRPMSLEDYQRGLCETRQHWGRV